jgi:hypothetical protein
MRLFVLLLPAYAGLWSIQAVGQKSTYEIRREATQQQAASKNAKKTDSSTTHCRVGINLARASDGSSELPFVDVFRFSGL